MIKKGFCFLFLVLFVISCSKDNPLDTVRRNVVSEGGNIPFEELLLLIHVKTTDSTYLVVKSIDSINIYINNRYWTKTNSQPLDTSKINKQKIGNESVSGEKVNYLVIANQDMEQDSGFTTAGQFAQYLNARYELKPGEYACFIKSFQITFNDHSSKTYYPFKYIPFKIEKDLKSAYVGEVELKME